MSNHQRWLKNEVARWRADGLIDEAIAQRILARHPDATGRGWGRIVFSAKGLFIRGRIDDQ